MLNNPLSYTDPSGFFFSNIFKAIGNAFRAIGRAFMHAVRAIARSSIGRAILQIAACALVPQGCFAIAGGMTLASGGSLKEAIIAAGISFMQIGAYENIHGAVQGLSGGSLVVTKLALHAVVGGAVSMAQGGDFVTGALTGAVSAGASLTMDNSGIDALGRSGDGIFEKAALRTTVSAVAGGTASVLAGGKFANGAITGAFAQMFNAEGMAQKLALAGAEVGASFIPGVGEAQDLYVLGHPNSSLLERGMAGISLLANVLTGGMLPNAGGFIRAAGHLCSFDGETRVETKRGRVAIKHVKPGEDEVVTRNESTGETAYKLVSARFVHRDGNTTRLAIRDRSTGTTQTLVTTANHPFFVEGTVIPELRMVANGGVATAGTVATGRWTRADALAVGDRLVNADGSYSEVLHVVVEDAEQEAYNITVDGFHTYFVADPANDNAPAVWVHNACPNIVVGGGASLGNLSPGEIARIQNAANRYDTQITVVGSRANGTAGVGSDWDYVTAAPSKVLQSLPRGNSEAMWGRAPSEVIRGSVNTNLPHITFSPRGR